MRCHSLSSSEIWTTHVIQFIENINKDHLSNLKMLLRELLVVSVPIQMKIGAKDFYLRSCTKQMKDKLAF